MFCNKSLPLLNPALVQRETMLVFSQLPPDLQQELKKKRDVSGPDQAGFRLPLVGTFSSAASGRDSLSQDDFEIIEVGEEEEQSGRSITTKGLTKEK